MIENMSKLHLVFSIFQSLKTELITFSHRNYQESPQNGLEVKLHEIMSLFCINKLVKI